MKKLLLIAGIALMASCADNTPSGVPAINMANFDLSIAPQTDFYEYATGGWQAANPLKAEYARYGAFDVLRENNEIRLNDLFAAMSLSQSPVGSVEQKISDLYKMGLDSLRLNAEGVEPIKGDLDAIMSIENRKQLTEAIAKLHLSTASPLFSMGVGADLVSSNDNIIYIRQRGLGMGNRDYYLDKENSEIKAKYQEYLEKVFTLSGVESPAKGAEAVLRIEDAIAKSMSSNVELRDTEANYNPMSKSDFVKRYKAFDWNSYFEILGVEPFEKLIVGQPKALASAVSIISKGSISDLRYYLAAQYINSATSYLSDELYAASFDFFGRTMTGTEEPRPRWKRAMGVPNSVLGEAVGEIYVSKYFPAEDKERMVAMVENLRVALSEHINNLEWMSEETKAKAQVKLEAFVVKIGYPDTWKDYSSLDVDPAQSYWANNKAIREWYKRDNLAELNKPVDREEWHMSPQTVNAYYNPTTNEICFPAAILQPPFYNPAADDAVNYGAIGVVIGHEMTHGFDDQGRQFDAEGNMNNWWTEADSEAFTKKADVLIEQFNQIEVLPGLNADGALSLGENIADQGGLRVSHTAFMNTLGGVEPKPIDGFTADQRFYLGYANLWGQNVREAEIARLTKSDVHSLGKWRVNASLRNIEEFYKAFDIKEGDAMYMPQEERVVIW